MNITLFAVTTHVKLVRPLTLVHYALLVHLEPMKVVLNHALAAQDIMIQGLLYVLFVPKVVWHVIQSLPALLVTPIIKGY